MQLNINRRFRGFHLSLGPKFRLAMGSIVLILLITAVISTVEFRHMSNFVSDSMAADISDITMSTELAVTSDEYNVAILTAVGDADNRITSEIDKHAYLDVTDNIMNVFRAKGTPQSDSLSIAYDEFVATSYQFDTVIVNDFIDSREWYFKVLQPKYNKFRYSLERFNVTIYEDLHSTSVSFDQSYYRSLIPGIVSVGVGIIMCLLLQFFVMSYYVKPIRKMMRCLDSYLRYNHPYTNVFEGDDELQELNADIADVVDENISLKRRLSNRER